MKQTDLPDDEALAAIEEALAHRSPRPFVPALESRYEARRGPARRGRLAIALSVVAAAVMAAWTLDWVDGLSRLGQAVAWRAGLATVCVAGAVLVRRVTRPWQESLLFGFLWAGWVVLSLSLISGWFFVEDMFAQHLVHKTVLSCIAWVVFGILLWGRNRLGWRGHRAIRWTLLGFILLMLAYFGSKLVREFILHR